MVIRNFFKSKNPKAWRGNSSIKATQLGRNRARTPIQVCRAPQPVFCFILFYFVLVFAVPCTISLSKNLVEIVDMEAASQWLMFFKSVSDVGIRARYVAEAFLLKEEKKSVCSI